jgi:hypothetical protein
MSDETEEQARIRAYELWELAVKPPGENDRFWREAVADVEFRRVRREYEKRLAKFMP